MVAQRKQPKRAERTLFDGIGLANPVAATADPATSHEAAAKVTASGRRLLHAELVLALVRRYPGSTAVELWNQQRRDQGALGRHEVSRRLADLKAAGLVVQGVARKCAVRGTRMVTWIVTAGQRLDSPA